MKSILHIIFMLIPLMIFSQNTCEVTYISNEGFLVMIDDKKILIDALFDKINEDWCDSPSDSTVELMKKSEYPFNDVDIIAITHNHRDHFNKSIVIDHMLNNSKTIVICPNQVDAVLSESPDYEKIRDRIISITPNPLSDTNIFVFDISIRVLRLEHSHYEEVDPSSGEIINRHRDIENLGYLFNVNGTKVFHCGDTNPQNEEEYNTFKLNNEEINIAFVERLFFGFYGDKGLEVIKRYINSDYIILMHIPPSDKESYINYLKEEETVKIFERKMESILINTYD